LSLVLGSKILFSSSFGLIFYPIGSGSVDHHIFVDPDPGSKNFAEPMDPDPKHWNEEIAIWFFFNIFWFGTDVTCD